MFRLCRRSCANVALVGMVSTGLNGAWAQLSRSNSMLLRLVWGALVAGAVAGPCVAESLNPEQARQFIAGKMFAFSCVDGTRGAGRIQHDGSVAGSIQVSGSGPIRY